MTAPQVGYKIAGGEPTAKWKAASQAGAGVGGVVGIIVAYVVSKVDPTMPAEVLAAVVWLTTWALTQGSMMLAGYLKRRYQTLGAVTSQRSSIRSICGSILSRLVSVL
jgi:hypothetical protein